jgi:hypothetical protein
VCSWCGVGGLLGCAWMVPGEPSVLPHLARVQGLDQAHAAHLGRSSSSGGGAVALAGHASSGLPAAPEEQEGGHQPAAAWGPAAQRDAEGAGPSGSPSRGSGGGAGGSDGSGGMGEAVPPVLPGPVGEQGVKGGAAWAGWPAPADLRQRPDEGPGEEAAPPGGMGWGVQSRPASAGSPPAHVQPAAEADCDPVAPHPWLPLPQWQLQQMPAGLVALGVPVFLPHLPPPLLVVPPLHAQQLPPPSPAALPHQPQADGLRPHGPTSPPSGHPSAAPPPWYAASVSPSGPLQLQAMPQVAGPPPFALQGQLLGPASLPAAHPVADPDQAGGVAGPGGAEAGPSTASFPAPPPARHELPAELWAGASPPAAPGPGSAGPAAAGGVRAGGEEPLQARASDAAPAAGTSAAAAPASAGALVLHGSSGPGMSVHLRLDDAGLRQVLAQCLGLVTARVEASTAFAAAPEAGPTAASARTSGGSGWTLGEGQDGGHAAAPEPAGPSNVAAAGRGSRRGQRQPSSSGGWPGGSSSPQLPHSPRLSELGGGGGAPGLGDFLGLPPSCSGSFEEGMAQALADKVGHGWAVNEPTCALAGLELGFGGRKTAGAAPCLCGTSRTLLTRCCAHTPHRRSSSTPHGPWPAPRRAATRRGPPPAARGGTGSPAPGGPGTPRPP